MGKRVPIENQFVLEKDTIAHYGNTMDVLPHYGIVVIDKEYNDKLHQVAPEGAKIHVRIEITVLEKPKNDEAKS